MNFFNSSRKDKSPIDLLRQGGLQKTCHVYLHRERNKAIAATIFGKGIMFEEDGEVAVYEGASDIELGEVVKNQFIKSEVRPYDKRIQNRKKTDLPSYKVAGCKSVAQFERDYVFINVQGLNEANIIVRLESEPVQWGLSLTCLCNPLVVENLGGELHKIKKHFLKWERD